MTRDFLKEMGLDSEQIDKIMNEHGKGINEAKAKAERFGAENEQLKSELAKANDTLEKFKDYDNVKAEVEKYKAEAEKSKADYEKRISDMELRAKINDFTSSKKFVNDLTKDAINSQLEKALGDESNKGKSLDELLSAITEGKENIFVEDGKPTPPLVPNLRNDSQNEDGVMSAFKRMNPQIDF